MFSCALRQMQERARVIQVCFLIGKIMQRLAGKVAIVTGAGHLSNIGFAICDAFLREGANVVGTDFREEHAPKIIEQLEAKHGPDKFHYLRHDVTSPSEWAWVLEQTLTKFGQVDILVNNAGIAIHGGVLSLSLEDMNKVMAVNNDALFLGMKICAPYLEKASDRFSGGGSIINNLSMASYMPDANNVAYHVSKAAGRMLTLCGAVEFAPKKIRVNSVHLGLTMTQIVEGIVDGYVASGVAESREAAKAKLGSLALLGRAGMAEEAANVFVYLASEESAFVTAAALQHDGGTGLRY